MMRGRIRAAACLGLLAAALGAAQAEPGGFFRNLLGGGESGGAAGGARLYDPDEAYCPSVAIRDGGAAVRAFAGGADDGTHLRHQITFGRVSRECARRPDGGVGLRVGIEVRALLGPAGASGSFEAPVNLTVRAGGKVIETRARRVRITVPAGAAQGAAAVIEDGLVVPAAAADNYEIDVALGGGPARAKGTGAAARRDKPVYSESAVEPPAGAPAR